MTGPLKTLQLLPDTQRKYNANEGSRVHSQLRLAHSHPVRVTTFTPMRAGAANPSSACTLMSESSPCRFGNHCSSAWLSTWAPNVTRCSVASELCACAWLCRAPRMAVPAGRARRLQFAASPVVLGKSPRRSRFQTCGEMRRFECGGRSGGG